MKGKISEAELHFIGARLRGGILSKARRGELVMPLPVGLVYDAAGHVILDPDTAIQGALGHLFATFEATGSATACVKAFNSARLLFPWRTLKGPRKGETDWPPLAHHVVLRVLHNPRYAGCFTDGRHRYQTLPAGQGRNQTRRLRLPREEWISFIPGAHPGYITLEQHDANLARLAANSAAHGRDRAAGPPRGGTALLQGVIICGPSGLRMTIRYHHRSDHTGPLTNARKARIGQLVPDLPAIRQAPAPPQRERTRIARLLLTDVTVSRTSDTITAHVRLAGGQACTLTIPAPLPIGDQRRTPAGVVTAIDELLDQHTSGEIAGILNQRGMVSGTSEPFHRLIVDHIIRTHQLRRPPHLLPAAGMLTL